MGNAKHSSIIVNVRFRDLDAMGHVNYATYLTYLEEAANYMWGKVLSGIGRDIAPCNLGYVIARAEIDYRQPALLGQTLKVSVWVTALGANSFNAAYKIEDVDSGDLIAEAITIQVITLTGKKHGMPDEVRRALTEHLTSI